MELKLASCLAMGFAALGLTNASDAAVIQTAKYNNHTYYLLDRTDTWQDAENEAISLGGHLTTVNNSSENYWILNTFRQTALDDMVNDFGGVIGVPSLWTGYIRDRGATEWYWVNGESSTYTNWADPEPANSWDEVTSGILLRSSGVGSEAGRWHDILDPPIWQDYDYGVVEVVPVPASFLLMCTGLFGVASVVRRHKYLNSRLHGK
jgi:hypothetical protein